MQETDVAQPVRAPEKTGYRPVLWDCLKKYSSEDFRADLIAGIVVGIVALPLSIALAIAVNAPPQSGLYTAIVAGIFAAAFGGSRVQVSGPTAAFIVVLAPICSRYGLQGLMVAGGMAGIMLIIMGVTGLGSLIKYVPYPVTTGFTAGIAVTIATIQIKDFFGLQTTYERVRDENSIPLTLQGVAGYFTPSVHEMVSGLPDHYHEKLQVLFQAFWRTPAPIIMHTAIIGLLTLVIQIVYPRLFPTLIKRIPPSLVALMLALFAAVAANQFMIHALGWTDVATIGSRFTEGIPRGLPAFNTALFTEFNWSFDMLKNLFMPAVAIAILGGIASLLSAVVADGLAGTRHDSNTELIGQGIANLVSPLFGGIAATGAIARTTTGIRNGARTPMTAVFHACTLALILLAVAPYAVHIPMAALASMLIMVAYGMADLKQFRHLLRAPHSDVIVLFICLFLTVFMDMAMAVMTGMICAALLFMRRMAELTSVDPLSSVASDAELQSHEIEPHDIPRGVTIYSVDGPFFFGAAEKALNALEVVGDKTRVVVLRLTRVPAMDASGLYALEKCYELLQGRGVTLVLSGLRPQPREVMLKSGFLEKLGAGNVTPDIEWALVRCYELLGPAANDRHSGKTTIVPKVAVQ